MSGTDLFKDAKDSQKDLQGEKPFRSLPQPTSQNQTKTYLTLCFLSTAAEDDLNAQKKRLKDADIKKKALEKDLLDVQAELDNINRGWLLVL